MKDSSGPLFKEMRDTKADVKEWEGCGVLFFKINFLTDFIKSGFLVTWAPFQRESLLLKGEFHTVLSSGLRFELGRERVISQRSDL